MGCIGPALLILAVAVFLCGDEIRAGLGEVASAIRSHKEKP